MNRKEDNKGLTKTRLYNNRNIGSSINKTLRCLLVTY